jgi:perosamine synthetase
MIYQSEPFFGIEEAEALKYYVLTGAWLTEGKKTKEFEELLLSYLGVDHCIMVNNGTVSLTLIMLGLGIGRKDEVIVPNFTMIASANSVVLAGAKPIFCDVEEDTLCLDLDEVKKKITKRTKAVMLVNVGGRYPKRMEELVNFCREKGLHLIEDSAQALGSKYETGEFQGTVGVAGSYSFSPHKILSTGQGGMIVTNNNVLADKIRKLKDFGRVKGGNDIHDSIGYNFKFTDLQAVVGIEQFKKLVNRIEKKKQIHKLYAYKLKNEFNIQMFEQPSNTVPWFIDVVANKRDELSSYLHSFGVETRYMYGPINKQKAYCKEGIVAENMPVSEMIGKYGLWLPSSVGLREIDVKYICDKIREFYIIDNLNPD